MGMPRPAVLTSMNRGETKVPEETCGGHGNGEWWVPGLMRLKKIAERRVIDAFAVGCLRIIGGGDLALNGFRALRCVARDVFLDGKCFCGFSFLSD